MLPEVPPITEDYPDFGRYLPWGPFYGIFVKRDVPDDAKAKLVAAFDHSIHVAKGVACVTCHGQVDQMPLMMQASSMQMEWCLECHRQPGGLGSARHQRERCPPARLRSAGW
jgi:hypothetical protein